MGRSVTVHLIENNVDEGEIIGYSASFDPKVFIEDPKPLFLREEGITKAHNALGKDKRFSRDPQGKLVIYKDRKDGGKYKLCWQVKLSLEEEQEGWVVYIDARTGEEIDRSSLNVHNHGYVAGRIFPHLPADPLELRPIGGQEITFNVDLSTVVTDIWGSYGKDLFSSLTTNLSGPYCEVMNLQGSINPYTFAHVAEYDWIETLTPTGIIGDEESKLFPLSFNFPFYGQNLSSIYICSNGYLSFSPEVARIPTPIPSCSWPDGGLIAPLWRNLDLRDGGEITYLSDANQFVVTWDSIPDFGNPAGYPVPHTFQAILRHDGTIRFHYKDVNLELHPDMIKTSIGIEDISGQNGVGYYELPVDGTAIEFNSSFDYPEIKTAHSFYYSNKAISDFSSVYYGWEDHPDAIELNLPYDDCYTAIELPFSFWFYGQYRNVLYVSSNGFISTGPSYDWTPDPIPGTYLPMGLLRPFGGILILQKVEGSPIGPVKVMWSLPGKGCLTISMISHKPFRLSSQILAGSFSAIKALPWIGPPALE